MKLTFLDPGQLRTEMVLQEPVETPDGSGGFVVTWVDVAACWVGIETAGARAENFGARQQEEVSHRITMRFRGDVRPGQRLLRGATPYQIKLVTDLDGTGRYLSCLVLEERP